MARRRQRTLRKMPRLASLRGTHATEAQLSEAAGMLKGGSSIEQIYDSMGGTVSGRALRELERAMNKNWGRGLKRDRQRLQNLWERFFHEPVIEASGIKPMPLKEAADSVAEDRRKAAAANAKARVEENSLLIGMLQEKLDSKILPASERAQDELREAQIEAEAAGMLARSLEKVIAYLKGENGDWPDAELVGKPMSKGVSDLLDLLEQS